MIWATNVGGTIRLDLESCRYSPPISSLRTTRRESPQPIENGRMSVIGNAHQIATGYVFRHLPPQSRLGKDVAILDIAQESLPAHLNTRGVFEIVTCEGGTALRKLFAGADGRLSTGIDLAAIESKVDRNALADLVAAECNVNSHPSTIRFCTTGSALQATRRNHGGEDRATHTQCNCPGRVRSRVDRAHQSFLPIRPHACSTLSNGESMD